MIRTFRSAGIVAVLVSLAITLVVAQQSASHAATLAGLSADRLSDGSVVVTMVASGDDLQGLVTFQLRPDGSGGYGGEWAMTVSRVDHTDPETGIEPPSHPEGEPDDHDHGDADADADADDHPHKDFASIVHRGSLDGTITAAQLTFNAQGVLTELTAPLTVDHGFKEFEGAIGSGDATVGTLNLTF